MHHTPPEPKKAYHIMPSQTSMAFFTSFATYLGICGGDLDLSAPCTQRAVIDAINLVFLLVFYLLLASNCISKKHSENHTRRSRALVLVSVSCIVISATYFGACFWCLVAQKEEDKPVIWIDFAVRGLIWVSLGVSSLTQGVKSVRIYSSLWWVSSFLLVSALNINILVTKQELKVIDILAWPVNLFLLICAFKNLGQAFIQYRDDNILEEPLLSKKAEKETQGEQAKPSFFSWLTFSWINPLLRLGYAKPLVLEDLSYLFPEDEASLAYQRFKDAWESVKSEEGSGGKGKLVIKALLKVYLKEMVCIGIGAFVKTLTAIASPLLLYAFVENSNTKQENLNKGLFLLGCLIMVKVAESMSQRHWFFQARRTGMRIRSALMVAVYQKQLKLSSLGRRRHSTGEIVNYMAVDAYRMGEFPWWFHTGWTMVAQLFLSIGVLYGVMGIGTLPGLVPLFIFSLLNMPFAKLLQKHQTEFMKAQDERLRATSEILNNMKVIKLQSWEEKFKGVIETCRAEEFKHLAGSLNIKAAGTPIFWMCPTIISSTIFLGCIILHSAPLDAVTIFTVLATLRSMSEPVRMIPEVISALIQVMVSFDRIGAFLLDDELKNEGIRKLTSETTESCIMIDQGNFSWDQESTTITLQNINLEVKKGQKVAVCGPVGAGKSSLLYAILKEIPTVSGSVDAYGSIAYVAQTSWIQSGTIRSNILYGKPMDQARYEQAIKSSALDKDINSFSHGDLTEIGQRGINMSGGQKQRIQLARAVYNDADVYLLDDPFSAVDAHTAATLFNDCVMDALEDKTVILVTHQVEFLSAVDKILVMEDGQIKQCGRYQELLMAGTAFNQLVNAHKDAITITDPQGTESMGEPYSGGINQPVEDNSSNGFDGKGEISTEKGLVASQLTEEEEKGIGDVGWKPFFDYILVSKGIPSLCFATLAQCAFVILQTASTYWLALAIQIPSISSAAVIGTYAGISALSTFFVYLRSFFAAVLGLKASKAFFSGLNNSIFKAPMLFFDSTPIGRIFTRASSDMSIVDNDISFSIALVLAPAIELVGMIAVMASVTWQILIVFIITTVASNYVQRYYLASAREIVRINGTTKAPVMNYAAETSLGVTTIRAFNMVDRFFRNYLQLVDTDAKLFFYTNASTEWLIIRIEALQNITLFTATFLLLLLPKGYTASGLVGLSLSYALTLTGTQVFMTRWYCNLSNYIISVERIKQFMHIHPEPSAIVNENRPPPTWPNKGRIALQDLKIRYRPNTPLVLKGITCTFHEGTRVGVVGRTGSGKTTLISALFRLVEPESGRILIDGLDICSVGLKDLRTKLSIIPQEPTLFRGSVRTNLDPLGLYSDHEIWEALEKCQLKSTISNLPKQLDSSVSDEGENWSTGQRQLFCLGRVLLKRNRILVLDEATASIDSKTDSILQKIIREEFSNCTVITVAHRVPTVIDSNMVMVLSFGQLMEYDEPTTLMQTNSSFSKLVREYWSSCRRSSNKNLNL